MTTCAAPSPEGLHCCVDVAGHTGEHWTNDLLDWIDWPQRPPAKREEDHWSNHAKHVDPKKGCHLCDEPPTTPPEENVGACSCSCSCPGSVTDPQPPDRDCPLHGATPPEEKDAARKPLRSQFGRPCGCQIVAVPLNLAMTEFDWTTCEIRPCDKHSDATPPDDAVWASNENDLFLAREIVVAHDRDYGPTDLPAMRVLTNRIASAIAASRAAERAELLELLSKVAASMADYSNTFERFPGEATPQIKTGVTRFLRDWSARIDAALGASREETERKE